MNRSKLGASESNNVIQRLQKTHLETPGDDCPALRWAALVALATAAARRLRASLANQIAAHGLSESEFALLWACYCPANERLECEGLTQIELAQTLELSPASVSGLVDALRRVGLLAGTRSTVDRRRQVWHLTDAGRTLIARLIVELADWSATLDGACDREEQRTLTDTLSPLLKITTVHEKSLPHSGELRL